MAGTEHRRVVRVAHLDAVVEHDAVGVVGDLSLEAELDRACPSRPLAMGRASVSWSETIRVDPSGTSPARRVRVWATICFEHADGALEFGDEGGGLARGSVAGPAQRPAGVGATTWASLMVASAIVANSPVSASTSSLASPLRRRSHAAI